MRLYFLLGFYDKRFIHSYQPRKYDSIYIFLRVILKSLDLYISNIPYLEELYVVITT